MPPAVLQSEAQRRVKQARVGAVDADVAAHRRIARDGTQAVRMHGTARSAREGKPPAAHVVGDRHGLAHASTPLMLSRCSTPADSRNRHAGGPGLSPPHAAPGKTKPPAVKQSAAGTGSAHAAEPLMLSVAAHRRIVRRHAAVRVQRAARPAAKVPPKVVHVVTSIPLTRAGADVAATGLGIHQAGIDDAEDAQRRDDETDDRRPFLRHLGSSSTPHYACGGMAATSHPYELHVNSLQPLTRAS